MKNTIHKWFMAVFAVCLFQVPAMADSISLGIENDVFLHDDSDYSHGTQVKYVRDSSAWIFDAWGVDILQNMYTPNDISSTEVQVGDRPYCGLLLASMFGDSTFTTKRGNEINTRNELGIGMTGPGSFAQDSQKVVHSIIGSKEPKGWDHQVSQEFIVQYQGYLDVNLAIVESEWFSLYDIWRASVFIGNYKDQAAIGMDLKLGLNPEKNKGGNISFSASRNTRKPVRISLLGGVEGKYVAWDTSLDGTMFRDSEYTVESEDFVGEIHCGATLGLGPVDIDFIAIFRTKEYEGQDEAPDYCRLAATVKF